VVSLTWHLWFSLTFGSGMIGFFTADAHSLSDNFIQSTYSAGGLHVRRSFLKLVLLVCAWVTWNERNLRVLKNLANSTHHLLDTKVKMFSYRWLRTTYVTLVSNFYCWWLSLLLCLELDWLYYFVVFMWIFL
jgi:hypothetical protein